MKIAYFTTTPFPTEKANGLQSLEVAKALCNLGNHVDFFCPKTNNALGEREIVSEIEAFYGRGLPFQFKFCRKVSFKNRFSGLLSVPILIKAAVSSGKYDYYYLRNSYLMAALVALRKPVIFEQHQWNSYANPLKSRLVRCLTLIAGKNKNCKLFICISEELKKRWLVKGLDPSKTITAHDAVDINVFTPIVPKTKARQILGIKKKMIVVSYVGSLYQNRAIPDILWVASKKSDVHFRFIGGPESEKLKHEKFVKDNNINNVQFVGRIQHRNIPLQLFASDVLLFTMNENTLTYDICSPMKIFEYLGSERLIVAPDLPSIREILKSSFVFLYRFPIKYSLLENLEKAINSVKKGRADVLAKHGRQVVEQKYTWDHRTKRILDALDPSQQTHKSDT